MSTIIYNKLVRDKIPQIIEQTGKNCTWGTLSDEQYFKLLKAKLLEEANEYIENDNISELADLLEVIYALLEYNKVTQNEIENIRMEKLMKRGGFEKRIILKEVEE